MGLERSLSGCDVLDMANEARGRPGSVGDHRYRKQPPCQRSVGSPVALLELVAGDLPASQTLEQFEIGGEVVGVRDGLKVRSKQILRRSTEQPSEGVVGHQEPAIRGDDGDADRGRRERRLEARLRGVERRFCGLTFADVAGYRGDADHRAALVEQR
jgi:hypothetical protein